VTAEEKERDKERDRERGTACATATDRELCDSEVMVRTGVRGRELGHDEAAVAAAASAAKVAGTAHTHTRTHAHAHTHKHTHTLPLMEAVRTMPTEIVLCFGVSSMWCAACWLTGTEWTNNFFVILIIFYFTNNFLFYK